MDKEVILNLLEPDIKAKSKCWHIKGYDQEDLEQEMRLYLWIRLDIYNPNRSSIRTFADRVMTNRLKNLLRDSLRQKRKVLYLLSRFSEKWLIKWCI
jgi:DNA-directed RNA polymerase specialized sigma24 family protein